MASETVTTTAVELQSLDHSLRTVSPESPIEDANEHEMASLPQVDGGKDAWLFLAACFLIEGLVWGVYIPSPTKNAPSLTLPSRLWLLLRRLPSLLQHPRALRQLRQHRRGRHLRHGHHVPRHAARHGPAPPLPPTSSPLDHRGTPNHVSRLGSLLFLHHLAPYVRPPFIIFLPRH